MKITRRELLASMAAAPIAVRVQRRSTRPKLSADLHDLLQVLPRAAHRRSVPRRLWLERHWHHPPMDLVSIYIDQIREDDVSKSRLEQFPAMKLYPTIAEALTLGG